MEAKHFLTDATQVWLMEHLMSLHVSDFCVSPCVVFELDSGFFSMRLGDLAGGSILLGPVGDGCQWGREVPQNHLGEIIHGSAHLN